MALIQSPSIVTDGLVFYYDESNTEKSWKGCPTTNLAQNGKVDYYERWAITNSYPNLPFTKKTDVYVLTNGNNYLGSSSNYQLSSGSQYTISYWYYIDTTETINHYMIPLASNYAGVATVITNTFIDTNNTKNIQGNIGGWVWGYKTFTVTSTPTYMRGTYTNGSDNNPTGKVYITNVMIESGGIPSGPYAYTGTSRTSTTSLYNLVGSNTITANSLAYTSGNFNFNGSSSYINTGYDVSWNSTTPVSLTFVLKPAGSGGGFAGKAYPNDWEWAFYQNGQSLSLVYWNNGGGHSNQMDWTVGNFFIAGGECIIFQYVWTGTTSLIYKNGVLVGTHIAGDPSINQNRSSPMLIGGHIYVWADSFWSGDIPLVQAYNRALTSTEIQQNYLALRERFFGYQPITYIASSNIIIAGNSTNSVTITKTADDYSWNGHAYSTEAFTAPCTIEFTKPAESGDNGLSYAMIGWNTDPTTSTGYDTLDHAAYPFRTGGYEVYNNGSLILAQGSGVTWETTKRFYITYDTDGYIRHWNGDKLLYSANYGIGNKVYVDCSLYRTNATWCKFEAVKVCRRSWNGTNYV